MPSSYSTRLRLELMATGELSNTWGTHANNNVFLMLEQAISDVTQITAAGSGDITLTSNNGTSDENRAAILELTGARSAIGNIIVNTVEKWWFVYNNTTGGFALTVKTAAGTGISVAAGAKIVVYCDGTNVVEGLNYLSTLSLGTPLPVASGGTAAATAANARTNLGVAASGANADITSLTGLTTPLPIAEGGTAGATAAAARSALGAANIAGDTFTGPITLPAFVDLATGATVDLGAQASNFVRITGAGTISSFGTVAAGTWRIIRFAAATTLTYNVTSMILPGGVSIALAADDGCLAISLGSGNWYVPLIQKAASVLQTSYTKSVATDNSSSVIPMDSTIPQITEGKNFSGLNVTFTPKSTTSTLRIRVVMQMSSTGNFFSLAACFNGGANALAAGIGHGSSYASANTLYPIILEYSYAPGALTAINFTVRFGSSNAGSTAYVNQLSGGETLGGVITSSIEIVEFV